MTDSNVNSMQTTGVLVLIVPFAFVMIFLLKTWPILLGFLFLGLILRLVELYQWRKLAGEITPSFYQLLEVNRGQVSLMQLSLKAQISPGQAQRFLKEKAGEYGAQTWSKEGQTPVSEKVYYFMTPQSLGQIFDDSEPDDEEDEALDTPAPAAATDAVPSGLVDSFQALDEDDLAVDPPGSDDGEEDDEDEDQAFLSNLGDRQPKTGSLTQAELARRLDVHPSTVAKQRKTDYFEQWSQEKDPEGVAWEYFPHKKLFSPLDGN